MSVTQQAFLLFEQAALTYTDGDSLHNTAHMLRSGEGTAVDTQRALQLLLIGARHPLNHFDCSHAAGTMLLSGEGTQQRDAAAAVPLLLQAAQVCTATTAFSTATSTPAAAIVLPQLLPLLLLLVLLVLRLTQYHYTILPLLPLLLATVTASVSYCTCKL